MKNYLILVAGIVGAASSVFFIKASDLAPATLSAARLLIAALVLTPFMLRALKERGRSIGRIDLLIALPAAVALTIHYASWFIGVRETTAAMSTLIVNLNPVLMPFLVWVLMREKINAGEVVGSLVAIAGVSLLAFGKDASGQNSLYGALVCVFSIVMCAIYLAFGRRFGRGRSIFIYIVPVYWMAGMMSILFAIAFREPVPHPSLAQILIAIGAAVVPTVIGHTALNHAMIHLPSQVVSIANLGQFLVVVLTIIAFPALGEYPTWDLLLPALLVLSGAFIVIRFATPTVKKEIAVASTEPAGS